MPRLALLAFIASSCGAQSMCGAFLLANATTRPQPSGGGFCAFPVSNQLVSFTEYNSRLVGSPLQVQVATRTGFATPCKTIGKLTVWCGITTGPATAGANVSLSTAPLAVAFYPIRPTWYIIGGFEVNWLTTPVPGQPSTSRQWGVGFSKGFAK
jgi:hypothetical protein